MAACRVAAIVLMLGLASTAQAELVAFADGRVLKADDAYLDGSTIVIELRGGGTLRVPASGSTGSSPTRSTKTRPRSRTLPTAPGPGTANLYRAGIPYRQEITTAAKAADIQPWLLVAVVRAESNFDPMAVSRAGAAGLAQLMPATASDRGVVDVFDPEQNLRAGAAHLRALLERFDSLTLALAAYNAGPATVDRYQGVPPYRETRNYVRNVTRWFCGEASSSA